MTALLPDKHGFYGQFGGKFVPETLMAALDEFESAYKKLKRDREFRAELNRILEEFVGRPSPLTEAPSFAKLCGNFRLFLKREDLNHTGAH
jgi:tryptophan synthase beta chain